MNRSFAENRHLPSFGTYAETITPALPSVAYPDVVKDFDLLERVSNYRMIMARAPESTTPPAPRLLPDGAARLTPFHWRHHKIIKKSDASDKLNHL